ncbi:hypothetical protein AX16_003183 [Volvariella volvacea WC 439]|uniref:1-aminocyclopropane-1-carboxylate synthase 2 n=1 Tax=Volvariella volvacea TaxID=36659 RepID=A0A386JTL9_9AGAR|nr:1-aminocyclopropane-1-carboxylate synthase 2 [Volvariella volvacea]KAF8655284.1 hypothetical protein AX16_003183 [Volvariella volvacea WC 439]
MLKLREAVDLSHHLSDIARARRPSPLKELHKYFSKPGLINMVGGLPNPDYFPYESISANALIPTSYANGESTGPLSRVWGFLSYPFKEKTVPLSISKYPAKPGAVNLADALQYSKATGLPQLKELIDDFTKDIYKPAYSDFVTLVEVGNTDGLYKVICTLCNPGEGILVEDWTYSSAVATMVPHGIRPVAVPMDFHGMRGDRLREILVGWDAEAQQMPRPHVMYTIPVGQNPTGITMPLERKQEIYDICMEFDIIIVEDDPYYFLQFGSYAYGHDCSSHKGYSALSHLSPTYLAIDTQGRVIRMDSFSKVVAPGSRLGWFTCNPMFAERLERQAEVSTQAPCGFSQALVTELLLTWKRDGYIQWLSGIQRSYAVRRNCMVDAILDVFRSSDVLISKSIVEGCLLYSIRQDVTVYDKEVGYESQSQRVIMTFIPPTSGMFVRVHLNNHPLSGLLGQSALERRLWTNLADAGLLLSPGWIFGTGDDADENKGHFRISFSFVEFEQMKQAALILRSTLNAFFKGEAYSGLLDYRTHG